MILADNISRLFSVFLFWILLVLLSSCEQSVKSDESKNDKSFFLEVQGTAQGTSFSIIYSDSLLRDLSFKIDSILNAYDMELSIYNDSSMISEFNQNVHNPYCMIDHSKYLRSCFKKAKEVYHQTNGAFNPAIYPLVKYWGFYDKSMNKTDVNSHEIDSLLRLISFGDEAFFLTIDTVTKGAVMLDTSPVMCKTIKNSKLDFNGIAQGHSVDVIADYFDTIGIKNYFIEIGGEVSVRGVNPDGGLWKIGIDQPIENSSPGENDFQMIVALKDLSLATSGNYRKFYEKDGMKYSHTIDPKTGYPVQHSLLSVTVLHDQTSFADAYATAFMVMGMEKSKSFIESNLELQIEAYFVYDQVGENKVWMTNGMKDHIVD